ncbi:MAG: ferritin-like domain-containing protein, partial [Bacteroidota bacterium]
MISLAAHLSIKIEWLLFFCFTLEQLFVHHIKCAFVIRNHFELSNHGTHQRLFFYLLTYEPLKKALGHEQYITKHIHEIVKAALAENDFPTYDFFQWFVREQ